MLKFLYFIWIYDTLLQYTDTQLKISPIYTETQALQSHNQ